MAKTRSTKSTTPAYTKLENVVDKTLLEDYHDQLMTSVVEPLQTTVSGTLKGSYSVVSVTADATVSGVNPAQGTEIDILYVNNTNAEHIVTIPASTYRTNTGENLLLVIPAGWYAEANYSNIGGTIYVRGM